MGRVVIVGYRPKTGQSPALERLVRTHHARLLSEGLVTERSPIAMRAEDGTVVEVFEWASSEAIAQAHESEMVQKIWAEFSEVCEYVPIAELPEASQLFSEFETI